MNNIKPHKPLFSLIIFGSLLLALTALMLIPSFNQAITASLGIRRSSQPVAAYNDFSAFIPFIPGYFPDDFEITHADTGSNTSPKISTYTETYASDTHFFKTIQSHGSAVLNLQPDPGFTIQDQPASLTNSFSLAQLMEGDSLDLSRFDTQEVWLATVILKEIQIQVLTNLPREEAIHLAEGLIPSICTSTPTPEGPSSNNDSDQTQPGNTFLYPTGSVYN